MADLINFTLPSITEGDSTREIKQIKNYLFQLTEQMRFYLNNIDSDNYTDDYKEKMSRMISTTTENAHEMSVAQKAYKEMNDRLKESIAHSFKLISGNKGGYIVINDSDKDGFPDELLIMDTADKRTAQSMWRWNHAGLMFVNGRYTGYPELDENEKIVYNETTRTYEIERMVIIEEGGSTEIDWEYLPLPQDVTVAIDMEGNINANCINAGILRGIRVEAVEGLIGNWKINTDGISTISPDISQTVTEQYETSINSFIPNTTQLSDNVIEVIKSPKFTSRDTVFSVSFDGSIFAKKGNIGGWDIRSYCIEKDNTVFSNNVWQSGYRVGMQISSSEYGAAFYAGCKTAAGGTVANPDASNFYVRHDGYLFAKNAHIEGYINATSGEFTGRINADSGVIGSWHIDTSTSRSHGLHADYVGSSKAYRVFLQPAYYDSSQATAANTWVISTQSANVTNGNVGNYTGTFIVRANGHVICNNGIQVDGGNLILNNLSSGGSSKRALYIDSNNNVCL